jgi:hypothetical protein
MSHNFGRWKLTWALTLMLALVGAFAYAQGAATTSSLSGTVVDSTGGVVPGADVVAKSNATATEYRVVTNGEGFFTIPSLAPGTYTVTVALTGFKTWSSPDVLVTVAPSSIKPVLEVGALEDTVVVVGATEIVQTQTATIQSTLGIRQLNQLPVVTHTALDFVVSLPGIDTAGSNTRGSTINGLPPASLNITLDGMNVQDKRSTSEGFYMYIRPMMDSVEEVTVTTSNPGAEASGQGASNIRMVTRSGSNRFTGSVYDTWRNQSSTGFLWGLNTPYWFNAKPSSHAQPYTCFGPNETDCRPFMNPVKLQTPGFRVGGPILKDKAFFFFNNEWFRLPEGRNRAWRVMTDAARVGDFTSRSGTTFNVFDYLAEASGGTLANNTADPSIAKLLADISTASKTTGSLTTYDANALTFNYPVQATQKRMFPTLRLDYNLTSNNRLTFNGRYNKFDSEPDLLNTAEPVFPGFPVYGGQVSDRYMFQGSVRSTIGTNMVNEFRGGKTDSFGLGTYFYKGLTESSFNCDGIGCQSAGGYGWRFGISRFRGVTNASRASSQSASIAAIFSAEDTFTWLKGNHTIAMGASWSRFAGRSWSKVMYRSSLNFGLSTLRDPVTNDYLDAAYPYLTNSALSAAYGLNSSDSGYVRDLYSVLTGRVTSMSGTAYLGNDGQYHFYGDNYGGSTGDDWGFYINDSWRLKPNLTLALGLRYELQLPYWSNNNYSRPENWQMVYGITGAGSGLYGSGNLYQGGRVQTGTDLMQVVPYVKGTSAYNTDWNNLGPSVSVIWRPHIENSFLSKLLTTDPVLRGGYSLSYTRFGTSFFDSNYSGNPGRSRSASRSLTSGTPLMGDDTGDGTQVLPVLLRDTERLFPGYFPTAPEYPITPAINEMIDIHYPDWPVPKTHQWSVGLQREFGKSTVMEIRYLGNLNTGDWNSWNMNSSSQWSMLAGENGFYDEFRLAQENLHANILAGNGTTFAYTGAPGTSPLPIFMAYLQGVPLNDPANQDPANYTASQFSTESWYNNLGFYSPGLTSIAGTGSSGLQYGIGTCGGDPTSDTCSGRDQNRINAGLPINFFMANPALALGSAYLETTGGSTRYNAVQFELRRRLSKGLLVQGSYQRQFGRKSYTQRSLRENWFYIDSTGGPVNSFKANWVYELPFGQGKPFGGGASSGWNRLIGGWEVDGVVRVQSGPIFNIGGYRLVGMTQQDVQKMFKLRRVTNDNGTVSLYMFPQDVIDQTIIAFNNDDPTDPTGYADGVVPTGRYFAPASGPDCVQYLSGMCPGTTLVRKLTGPKYWKVDLSIVKRIGVLKSANVEVRMDLFNLFNTVNYNAVGVSTGSSLSGWEVTSGATDINASQDPGGRITQFGLRFSW